MASVWTEMLRDEKRGKPWKLWVGFRTDRQLWQENPERENKAGNGATPGPLVHPGPKEQISVQ